MPNFSDTSLANLETCDPQLIKLFNEVIKFFDCSVTCGVRGEKAQTDAYNSGNSKVPYPESKHNTIPSKGIDVAPYIDGVGLSFNAKQCYYFAGFVMGIARGLRISIRWGGDWNKNNNINDQTFNDLVHFELE